MSGQSNATEITMNTLKERSMNGIIPWQRVDFAAM
jgi:hypothetical protein